MAKFKFARCPRRRRIKFFQSSPRYLNNNAATLYERGQARRWSLEEPQSSDHKILTFANGHYGIYFSLFNHELRKKENGYGLDDKRSILVVLPQLKTVEAMPEFHISKANQKIHNDIHEIKSFLSAIKPQSPFLYPTRNFSTTTRPLLRNPRDAAQEVERKSEESKKEREIIECELVDDFDSSFAKTQSDLIVLTFHNHNTGSELNVIFPLYQSLKRNGLLLPSIEVYNIVLKSISLRSLDSEASLAAIEQKLTCLLTVYEDILFACSQNREYAPTSETYTIVMSSMFENISKAIKLTSETSVTQHAFHGIVKKSHEFTMVGINLLLSIQDAQSLALEKFVPDLLRCVNYLPQCINSDLAVFITLLKDKKIEDVSFYSQMILASKHIAAPRLLNFTKKESYDYISTLYTNFKEIAVDKDALQSKEYEVYCALVESLILCGNLPVATKFVDQILVTLKEDSDCDKVHVKLMKNASKALSSYIECLILSGRIEDLDRATTLISKFRGLNYLPELDVSVHNNMIKGYITNYITQEIEKRSATEDAASIEKLQVRLYERILEQYNSVSIRKDFQKTISTASATTNGFLNVSCREALLSLALDIGDHSTVSRLLKEILLKDDIIRDWNISRKLYQYLLNGAVAYNNQYYLEVMWNLAEQQSSHFKSDSVELHNFLSEHSDFLLQNTPFAYNKVLNLLMVYNAMSTFSIEASNSYGVVSVMNFLIKRFGDVVNVQETFKILQYQSLLIHELEDTDNHYLELCPQLEELKLSLTTSFKQILLNCPSVPRSDDISFACKLLGVTDTNGISTYDILKSDFRVSLSSQLAVNYGLGIRMFLNYFKDGYSFNDDTINAIISRDFVYEVLESENVIKVRDFIHRLFGSDTYRFSSEAHLQLISLIELGNEKVNLKIFTCLTEGKFEHLWKQEKIVEAFSQFASRTQNKQFLRLFSKNFDLIKSLCPNRKWILIYLKHLVTGEDYTQAINLVQQDYPFYTENLNLQDKVDEEFLESVLTVLIKSNDPEAVNQIFKKHFAGVEGNKILLKSEKLLSCFLDYYIAVGSYDSILRQFSTLTAKSPLLRQKVQFARYLAHLDGSDVVSPLERCDTRDDLIMSLINETDIFRMRDTYKSKLHLTGNKDEFFQNIVETLNRAATFTSSSNLSKIRCKFEAIIKLCKVIDLTRLSSSTLSSIIKFLATTRSTSLLHILFNKFSNNNVMVWNLNFFFLHIEIHSSKEAHNVLQTFKEALIQVGDSINLAVLEQMKMQRD